MVYPSAKQSKIYPPLKEARKSLRINFYRSPIAKEEFRILLQLSDIRAWLQTLGVVGYLLVTGGLTYYFFFHQMWVLFALALFAYGTYASFLGSGCHEFTHGRVFKTKWLNKFFLYLFGLINMFNHEEYLLSHTYHHRYTLHPEGDREVLLPVSPVIRPLYILQMFTINLFGGPGSDGIFQKIRNTFRTAFIKLPEAASSKKHDTLVEPIDDTLQEWLSALYKAHPNERIKAVRWARLILLFHALVIAVSVVFQLWLLPVLITLSRSLANWLKNPAVFLQHAGLRTYVADFRKSTRTIKLDPVTSLMYWYMNWHVEHHMYPGVPCYNLRRLNRVIKSDLPRPKGLLSAYLEVQETWNRQQFEPEYQFDMPLPAVDVATR